DRSARAARRADPARPRLAAPRALRLERRRARRDAAPALPPAGAVERATRPSALSGHDAQLRRLPGAALQHRLLRAAHDDDCAGAGARARRARLLARRHPRLLQPFRAGAAPALARAASAAAHDHQPGREEPLRLPLRRLPARRLRPASAHPGADRGLDDRPMRISLVVAAARNGVIGHAGGIPWKLPDDQRFFRALTQGHCIVIGRKTHEEIGRALPGRKNLVVSRTPRAAAGEVEFFTRLVDAIEWARAHGFAECFIAGGEGIYREGLAHADCIYLTRV